MPDGFQNDDFLSGNAKDKSRMCRFAEKPRAAELARSVFGFRISGLGIPPQLGGLGTQHYAAVKPEDETFLAIEKNV